MLDTGLWYLQLLLFALCNVRVAEVTCFTSLDLSMASGHLPHSRVRVFSNASLGLEPEEDNHQCKWDKRGLRFKGLKLKYDTLQS